MFTRRIGKGFVTWQCGFGPVIRIRHKHAGSFSDGRDRFTRGKDRDVVGKGPDVTVPGTVDVLIVGGGVIGSSVAYWLKREFGDGSESVAVIEKDFTYSTASTVRSSGGIRQQFSIKENIELCQFSAEFLLDIKDYLTVPGHELPEIHFNPSGYLFLANKNNADIMLENHKVQIEFGAHVDLLSPATMKEKFPWLNVDDIELGSLGKFYSGWFDPWSLLNALKHKAKSLGAHYVEGEVVDFGFQTDTNHEKINSVKVQLANGTTQQITFKKCVIAGGSDSGKIAQLAKIGIGNGLLSTPLPVEPRKRFIFYCHVPKGPLSSPMLVDPTGVHFRPDSLDRHYLCLKSPRENEEPDASNLDVDPEYFEKEMWSDLAHRVPAFEEAKVKSSWAGYYDYNVLDRNAIIGAHPRYRNLFFATGFSGHGLQQAPAAGRAVMELITGGGFKTIDLSRFSFERIITKKPIYERDIL